MFFINPFIYAAGADFESIATVTVGSGGASSITFSDLPSGFQHLQIRMVARSGSTPNNSSYASFYGRFNDDTGTNYNDHYLRGNGSAASAGSDLSQTGTWFGAYSGNTSTASVFTGSIVDVLDYASTSKYKTVRCFEGFEQNTSTGYVDLVSSLWRSTSAITKITIVPSAGETLAQYSTAALYGIKAP